jgi:hypothetical protein
MGDQGKIIVLKKQILDLGKLMVLDGGSSDRFVPKTSLFGKRRTCDFDSAES